MSKYNFAKYFLLLLLLVSTPLLASDKKTIFYNVTTDDAWTAGMALGQANMALKNGYKVAVFLNVRGVLLASKAFHSDSFAGAGTSLQEMLKTIMQKGGKVIICPMCMKKLGMTMDDVLDGIAKGGADVTIKLMTDDDTVVISY